MSRERAVVLVLAVSGNGFCGPPGLAVYALPGARLNCSSFWSLLPRGRWQEGKVVLDLTVSGIHFHFTNNLRCHSLPKVILKNSKSLKLAHKLKVKEGTSCSRALWEQLSLLY